MQRQAAPAAAPAIDMSVIDKYIGLSNPSDRIKSERQKYRKEIETSLRAAIATLPYAEAVEKVSQLDGLMCLLALIALVEEMKTDYARQLQTKYKLNMDGAAKILEEKFETFLDSIIAKITAKRRGNVTQAEIDQVIAGITNDYWQKLIKAKVVQPGQKPDEEFIRLVKNYAFLVSASKVYRDTDDMQMLDLEKLTAYSVLSQGPLIIRIYRMPKEKMIESYQALARCADQLILSDDEKDKWGQLSVWLYGLYNRIFRAVDKKYIRDGEVQTLPNGQYPTVDDADKAFLKHKGITKYFMSLFNRDLSLKLANRLGLLQNNVSSLSSAAAAASSSSPSDLPAASGAGIAGANEQRNRIQIQPLANGRAGWSVTAILPVSDKDTKDGMIGVINAALSPAASSEDDVTLPNWLTKCANASDDDKIKRLDYCISRFVLQPNQQALLQFISRDVKSAFKAYRGKSFLLPMTHADKSLVAEKRVEEAKSPKEQIEILLLFRDELRGENSRLLKKAVDEILMCAYNQLAMSVPEAAHAAEISSSSASAANPSRSTANAGPAANEISCEVLGGGEGGSRISVNVYDERRRDKLIAAMDAALNPLQHNDEALPMELAKCSHADNENKIRRLAFCINNEKFALTPNQNELLRFIARDVKAAFSGYRNSSLFFRMTHDEESQVAEQQVEGAQTPKEQLNILLELRAELKGNNSEQLKRAVDAILLSAYNQLLLSMPEASLGYSPAR